MDAPVYDYVMKQPETQAFYSKLIDVIEFYQVTRRKANLVTIAIAVPAVNTVRSHC